jgi:hypothetical protein
MEFVCFSDDTDERNVQAGLTEGMVHQKCAAGDLVTSVSNVSEEHTTFTFRDGDMPRNTHEKNDVSFEEWCLLGCYAVWL